MRTLYPTETAAAVTLKGITLSWYFHKLKLKNLLVTLINEGLGSFIDSVQWFKWFTTKKQFL